MDINEQLPVPPEEAQLRPEIDENSPANRPPGPVCIGCDQPLYEIPERTPLCTECREAYIRYPIPLKIKLFGAGVLALLVISLFSLPKSLGTAIHLKRGKEAMADHRFVTAQKELEKAVSAEPEYLEAQCQLLVAAYHNQDYATMSRVSFALEGKKIEDESLYQSAQDAVERAGYHFPSDSLEAFVLEQRNAGNENIPSALIGQYLASHQAEPLAYMLLASTYMEEKNLVAADSVLHLSLAQYPGHVDALQYLVALKREENQDDSALYFAKQLQEINREMPYSYGAIARILLKKHQDAEALKTVQKGLSFDPKDGYCLASLALIYHFNGDHQRRDQLIDHAKTDSALMTNFIYVSDVVSGKENFRN
jgi:Tfp pilus assembly protein PilF